MPKQDDAALPSDTTAHAAFVYALQNAQKFGGKANPKAIVGMLMKNHPELRDSPKDAAGLADEAVKKVNIMSQQEQQALLESQDESALHKTERKERDLFSSVPVEPGVPVTTAFPPEPSKWPHIGHAKALLINQEFARRNNGRFLLRFEDTNPALARPEFYQQHLDDYAWLGAKFDGIDYASAHMEEFYRLAERLITDGNAYICDCPAELMRENRMKGEACECRLRPADKNLVYWKSLFSAPAGTAVLRLKVDMQAKNTTLRDPTMFRIAEGNHARTGTQYRLWPSYDFENAVMDGITDVTHRFRSKEFEMRAELQHRLQDMLSLPRTQTVEFARFNLEGVVSSGREIRQLVDGGKLMGWDDPQLTTLAALRRRGFQPVAIREFCLATGISKAESTLTWDDLMVHNRRFLDATAPRYFFVPDPVVVQVSALPALTATVRRHPENDMGSRTFVVKEGGKVLLARADVARMKQHPGLYRLMGCCNLQVTADAVTFAGTALDDYRGQGKGVLQWLPVGVGEDIEVLMPDHDIIAGMAEPESLSIPVGQVVQFERFGFVRCDARSRFWFTHK